MKSGKLDEELSRMSEIIEHLRPGALMLFNESFAATNEREGSEIARQIMTALLEKGIRIVCVTHLFELARGFYERNAGNVLFLRAERARSFKLLEGEPLPTSLAKTCTETSLPTAAKPCRAMRNSTRPLRDDPRQARTCRGPPPRRWPQHSQASGDMSPGRRTIPALRAPAKASTAPSPATTARPAPGTSSDRTNPPAARAATATAMLAARPSQ